MADEDEENFYNYNPWYPPTYWMDFTQSEIFDEDKMEYYDTYLLFLYHSVLFIGQNEMGPVNTLEMFGCSLILIGNLFINLFLFGNLMVIVDYFIMTSLEQ